MCEDMAIDDNRNNRERIYILEIIPFIQPTRFSRSIIFWFSMGLYRHVVTF